MAVVHDDGAVLMRLRCEKCGTIYQHFDGHECSAGKRLIAAAKEVSAIARGQKPVTKSVTELRNAVTEIELAPRRGRRPCGDRPMTAAEKQRAYRERKRRAK